jgi:hypothetical protein
MATKNSSQVSTLDDIDPAVGAAAPTVVESAIKGANFDAELSGKAELITVHSTEGDGGNDAVFLSVNGYAYQIPRDKPFQVPSEVAQVLRDAKVASYKTDDRGNVTETYRQRYAFSSQPA